ncbi:hypothetical protein F0562_003149 [Nyssa sinensis]|uniref:Retrotransposon gag domain-containing protein n=1 Tax=Nyssa sinensis TaxID=561372 RepID=A0A5J5BVQ0_9ASTE|nr:hypothetical protein F0562_003149 [Nyssa sinensis]
MIEEDVLEHVRDAKTSHEAWNTFAKLFSKKNDTRLQLLESELLSVVQRDLTIAQYFHKVKSLCREISELDPEAPISETRMKRIIIHGLRPKFKGFVAAVQGWKNQPSLVEFENLLVGQEALAKQMGGVSLKGEEEALYAHKDSDVFKDELQSAQIQLSLGEAENAADGDIGDEKIQSPWQIGVHGQPSDKGEPSEAEAPIPLRRSARTKKPNPKYA